MISVLLLGLIMGMRHAIESDHVSAVASIMARDNGSGRQALKLGTLWGGGHALTLFGVGVVFLAFDWGAPEVFSQWLELAVGFMLVALGGDLVRRVVAERIHFHAHKHGGQVSHMHVHSHGDVLATQKPSKPDHDPLIHPHRHDGAGLSLRAFAVGMVHGVAGSAALVLLVLGTIQSFWVGVAYMLLFGVGSIVGMALLSTTISLPLRFSARSLTWAFNGLQGGIGVWTLALGVLLVEEHFFNLIG